MKFSSIVVCALLFAFQSALARADAPSWNWRFQPAPQSRWRLTIFERMKSLSAQDMMRASFDEKGIRNRSTVRQETLDQASHRAVFDLDVLSGDASSTQLRWTFREMQVTREREDSTFGEEKKPANPGAQVKE